MKVPLWAYETAALFWEAVGASEPFPRSLCASIHRSPFELTVKEMSGLTTAAAARYLGRLGPGWACGGPDRPLRACLAARDGAGFILLDAADAPAERVFSLAHELAHFLRHYWQPRLRASARLGGRILEVFDGRRPPNRVERLDALLASVPLGFHAHIMGRDAGRRPAGAVAAAEREADRLAHELLAPAAAIAVRLAGAGRGDRRERAAAELRDFFGLPAAEADAYASILFPAAAPDPLLLRLRGNS